ncbi:MAG: hypothetical protein ACOX47_10815 [Bacillota bacterium]
MDRGALNKLILELLEIDCYKTVDYLVEELRTEYPQEFRRIMKDFLREYDLSGCGAEMSPITVVNSSLNDLMLGGKVEKKREGRLNMWRRNDKRN